MSVFCYGLIAPEMNVMMMMTSWQLVASLVVFYIPVLQQVANLHVVIDLSGSQLVGNPKKLRTSWKLVRLVGCGLKETPSLLNQ